MHRFFLSMLGAALCLSIAASPALADDKAEAQHHFKAGKALMKSDDFKSAAIEFKKSFNLYPTKNALFNLAQCYKVLEHYTTALRVLRHMQDKFWDKLDDDMRAELKMHRKEIQELAAEIVVYVDQPGAAVQLDGRKAGNSPLPAPLTADPGEREIEVSLHGYKTEKRKVSVSSKEKLVESFELTPLLGKLLIKANISGARVFADGNEMGATPLPGPLLLTAGKHVLMLSKDGYKSVGREVQVRPGIVRTESFLLKSAAAPRRAAKPEPFPEETPAWTTEPAPPAPEDDAAPGDEGDKGGVSPLFWVGLGGTAFTGVLSSVFLGLAVSNFDDFKANNDKYEAAVKAGLKADLREDTEKSKEEVTHYRKLAWGFGITTGLLAVGTIVALAVGPSDDESGDAEVSVVPGGVAVRF